MNNITRFNCSRSIYTVLRRDVGARREELRGYYTFSGEFEFERARNYTLLTKVCIYTRDSEGGDKKG